MSASRLKDIIAQLADIIYLQTRANKEKTEVIFEQFTNLTTEECEFLNLHFANDP